MCDETERLPCRTERALRIALHDHRERVIRWYFDEVEGYYVVLLWKEGT